MRNKTKIILTLACASLCCLALGACKRETELDKLNKAGAKISVTYNANGGTFMGQTGITVVDMFNPDHFTDGDGDGKIEISLKGTDPVLARMNLGSLIGKPERVEYSFAGWYKTRELIVNDNGDPLDAYGNVLELRNGAYYIKDSENTAADPAYNYSDRWDFDEDKVVYELGSGSYALTLYAAWIPYYRFNFYYEKEGAWTLLESQKFDYTTTQRFHDSDYGYEHAVKDTVNSDYVWVPQWSGAGNTGAMNHEYKRSDFSTFKFPSLAGHTFKAAYKDETCTQAIETELLHAGAVTYNKESKNLVLDGITQNVYLKFDEGEQYRIDSAQDFVDYAEKANASSIYTILQSELDFTGKTWPSALTSKEFAGKIVGKSGGCTFKNITATNGNSNVAYGGLFGTIAASASIKNITFENVVYDMHTGTAVKGNGFAYYGVFAGVIETGADVSGITLNGFTLKMGRLISGGLDYKVNLICGNGDVNITRSGAKIELKSDGKDSDGFRYYVTNVSVDESNGNVAFRLAFASSQTEHQPTETYVVYPAQS